MVCEICGEKISDLKSIRLFDKDICSLCIYSIAEIPVNHILYDFYKDRVKNLQMKKIKEIL
jgi:hypothetical protein